MVELEQGAGAICVSPTLSTGQSDRESGTCVMDLFSARVSTTEESGAGKLHAGICAGGAG